MKVLTATVVSWVAWKLGSALYKAGSLMFDAAIRLEDWAGIVVCWSDGVGEADEFDGRTEAACNAKFLDADCCFKGFPQHPDDLKPGGTD